MITPKRRRGFEHLDDPGTHPALRERSLRDIRRANTMLGGANAVLAEVRRLLPPRDATLTLLDVGTGLADIPLRARRLAKRAGVRLIVVGLDEAESLAQVSADVLDWSVCGDARCLPFANGSIDVVTCSQVLHHFEDDEIALVLAEMNRVALRAVIVSDLRRSWLAVSGFWLVTWLLGFHAVSRHDGVVSVLRGFTDTDLASHVQRSIGLAAKIRRHLGYRLTATWAPSHD
ncbi:MAG: methyltransferase domain-containing protein [Gemmatimonadota bacterium]|nr:methyltransferase domain-containing protein [Gemmatimonadota bacterium]